MPRNIGADGTTVYRAVIHKTYADGRQWTTHEGPYPEPGPARARVTFWQNRMQRNGGTASGDVEQAHTTWAPIGERPPLDQAARAAGIREAAEAIDVDDFCGCKGCAECVLRAHAADLRAHADRVHPAQEQQ
ncbi:MULTISPECIES: hypothetical protein [Streptomyces rochei group]|uniref:hypothetical protein n=1 Tax=Streptomyces rochei group TaxID=2867164 RepID=UPI001873FA9D|nr:hypothetical protein [Streptomyces vinaceusdrappus]GHC44363.1 hypothetical protein GCM10010308_74500 [Streptomyces vinaceusdrappus]